MKLVVPERESAALERDLVGRTLVTSAISRVEVVRAVARRQAPSSRSPMDVLPRIVTMTIDGAVLSLAASLGPPRLRTIDAIHLASALQVVPDLDAFVTYDRQLGQAAAASGLPVETPR